ncbi:Rv2732c family membrane protein [Corynebacterium sp. 335C]
MTDRAKDRDGAEARGAAEAADGLAEYRGDLRRAERKVAGTITIGGTLAPVALCVILLVATYFLPHSVAVRGFDVLFDTETARAAATALPERIHAVLKLVTILLVVATLAVRQVILGFVTWVVGGINMWYAFAAGWMRQSRPVEGPGGGIAFGLWLAIIASVALFIALCFLVFRKSALQSALALARRDEADSDPVLRAQQVYLRSGLTPHTQTDVELVDDRREASRRRRAARREREAQEAARGAAGQGDAAARDDAPGDAGA